jgi:hypothetical protein
MGSKASFHRETVFFAGRAVLCTICVLIRIGFMEKDK